MSAANNYEAANLAEQKAARKAARATITVALALTIGTAAVIVAVLAALATSNLIDDLHAARAAAQGRCL